MRVIEICACGASCEVRDDNLAAIKMHMDDWREEHRCPTLFAIGDALGVREGEGEDE